MAIFNPGKGTLKSNTLEGAILEAALNLQNLERSSGEFNNIVITLSDRSAIIQASLPFSKISNGGVVNLKIVEYLNSLFLKSEDIRSSKLTHAFVELLHKLQFLEKSQGESRVQINYNLGSFTVLINADIPIKYSLFDKGISVVAVPYTATPENLSTTLVPLLLDKYSGASIALSLRKLRNDYTGDCIKINPSSNGVLVWYDQSGGNNKNFFQSNVSKQPIVIPGTSLTLNKPSVYFKTSQLLSIAFDNTTLVTPSGEVSIFFVLQSLVKDSIHLTNGMYRNNAQIAAYLPWNDGYTYLEIGNSNSGGIGTPLKWDTLAIASLLRSSDKMYIYKNNQKIAEKSSTVSFNAANAPLSLGSEIDGTHGIDGYISEVIIYNRYLENHQEIVDEINSYYKVF